MFKPGDKIRCIRGGGGVGDKAVEKDEIYTFIKYGRMGDYEQFYVLIEERGDRVFYADRFVLHEAAKPAIIIPGYDGDVRETALFKSIAPHIKSISTNRLIYELILVVNAWDKQDNPHIGFNKEHLYNAFEWAFTPQGIRYWTDLQNEVSDNRYG